MGQILSWFRSMFARTWARSRAPDAPATLKRYKLRSNDDNPLMFQFFHWDAKGDKNKSWWRIFEDALPELEALGVTQVWLPPPNKGMVPHGRGYDAYDLWDLGEFRQKGTVSTRWGNKQELLAAIRAAQERGIEVLIDAVLNHKLGADRKEVVRAVPVDPMNRNKELGPELEIEAWAKYDFKGRGGKYSQMTWNSAHFTGVDWDARHRKKGVFRFTGPGEHQGWSKRVDNELGNYDYLLGTDIDHRHPAVQEDLNTWGPWVLHTTGGGGFRLDAIKHMDSQFLIDWLRHTRDAVNRSDLFAVGEYWTSNAELLRGKMAQFEGELSFFDVPLHDTFHQASKGGPNFDLRNILKNSLVRLCPDDAVTFVDNHDTVIGQSLESWVGHRFKPLAYAAILLRQGGYPCVFYNDLFEPETPQVAAIVQILMLTRKHLAYGPNRNIAAHRNHVVWARDGDEKHPEGCVVIINNGLRRVSVRARVPEGKQGSAYINAIHPDERAIINHHSECDFTCGPSTVAVWVSTRGAHLVGINVH